MRAVLASVMCAFGIAEVLAQEPPAKPPNSLPAQLQPGRVIVEYRDADLTDVQLAQLVKVITSEVPSHSWPEAVVRKNELDSRRLLDRYYDIESRPSVDGGLPETARELTDLIERANKISALKLSVGQTLKMPPVPVLSLLAAATDTSVRLFDPASQKYAVIEEGGEVRAAFTRAPDQSAAVIKQARRSEVTAIALSPDAAAKWAESTEQGVPADNVRIMVPPNHVRVELLQQAKCPSMDDALRKSPYLDRARARIKEARGRILEGAANKQLRLIDFDFASGHGALVQSAAVWLLDRLEVGELEKFVLPFDLNPSSHVTPASPMPTPLFVPANDYWTWGETRGVLESSVQDVTLWLMRARPKVNDAVYTVPPVLLQSAIWDAFDKNQWVSLSWQVAASSGALPVELDSLLRNSGAFVTVAAGNDFKAIPSGLTPQSAAADSLHFVNVTYGAANGAIFGNWSSIQGGRVDVVAYACGFNNYRALTEKTTGSSLASPIVAAAAWLKHLLDGTSADRMRHQLAHASLLIPSMRRKILSGGIFDPARLLANVGAHYLGPDRTKLTEITVEELNAGSCGTFKPDPDRPQDFVLTTDDNGQYHLIRRHEVDDQLRVEPPCVLTTLVLKAVTANGRAVPVGSPQDFEKVVGMLTF